MALLYDQHFEHLLRRAGFGARPDELDAFRGMSFAQAIDTLLNFERILDDVDTKLGRPGYAGYTSRGGRGLEPNTRIADAQQRWLFRMLHTNRPLQEKMTLFWHNHFATAYSKIAGAVGAAEATRYMAAKPGEDPGGVRGQIEMLRDNALGNFQTLLVNIAKDTAMLIWLDGRANTKARPQENFGREIMELFTLGVGRYTEEDVYAAARVFTGWNLTRVARAAPSTFFYNAAQHDTNPKTFTFAIYPDGSKTIPARSASDGMQDGLDFMAALARSPHTAAYLARKLYRFFVSEFGDVDEAFVSQIAGAYLRSGGNMRAVMREVLWSQQFWDERHRYARYSWPVEYAVRAVKDIGWVGFSVDDARAALGNMGQILFDPPDVAGWETGRSWYSTGAMLARMNFASSLTFNQKFNLALKARPHAATPQSLLAWVLDSVRTAPLADGVTTDLLDYLRANGQWTGGTQQLQAKVAGVMHLLAGTAEYQFV
jgi:uncharacterized protein (DUF1800 family)